MTTTLPATQESAAPLWCPTEQRKEKALITRFERWLREEQGLQFAHYDALWQWSVDESDAFWSALMRFFDLRLDTPAERIQDEAPMPHTRWLPGARLNMVQQVLRHEKLETPALICDSEAAGQSHVSWPELVRQVGAMADALRALGVQPGDRVAGYLPNISATVVAFLAAASLGAVWTLCAPDMGPLSVVDRMHQVAPKVLIAVDGYRFAGKPFDRRAALQDILERLPSVQALVWVPHLDPTATPPAAAQGMSVVHWSAVIERRAVLEPEALPADHPLWILFSSGTTGLPKPIVHGHAGILLNGMVDMVLHNDLHPGDRVMWAVNTSWMVWNAHILGLLGGGTLVLYDGSVTGSGSEADWGHLWKIAARHRVNALGVGAAIHHACLKAQVVPREIADLSALHTVCATGSPLSPEAYRWLYSSVKADLWLNIVTGGTDIAGGFLVGLPTLPVYVGEMQCRPLGTRVEAWTDEGTSVIDEVGELVCTRSRPSMPLYFWGDTDGSRLHESYFDTFRDNQGRPVWRHGDWLRLVPRPDAVGGIVYGRSDATINRQGVRMGSSELYRVVEQFDAVADSLVVDLEYLGRPSFMALFVQLRSGAVLDQTLLDALRAALRQNLSVRHVPDAIYAVPSIPKTITGKKLELPIKRMLLGHAPEKLVNRDALAQPDSIDWFIDFSANYLRQLENAFPRGSATSIS